MCPIRGVSWTGPPLRQLVLRFATRFRRVRMRRVAILMLLALALPVATWAASSTDVVNVGGTLTGSSSGMTLSGSTLIKVGGASGTNLGTLEFSTGSLISGD